jgi:poly(3-hydroxybutyrate) depolymerase
VTGTVFAIFVAAALTLSDDPDKIVRKTFEFNGKERGYFLYEPADRTASEKLPLIVMLHGSGGDAKMLVDHWRQTASSERIVVMGPQSLSGRGWDLGVDSPDFFQALVEIGVAEYGADPRRVYLFGFSAGGHHAMSLAVLESEYFAAAAVYAGVLIPELNAVAEIAERRIPIVLVGGRRDTIVPPPYMEDTKARLHTWGWKDVQLHFLNNDHNYRVVSGDVNKRAWQLFKGSKLETDPKFKKYKISD